MIDFSMSSLLMSVLFSNILLVLLYLIFRNTALMIRIGYKLLAVFLMITLVRFLLPFEFFFSTNIYWPEIPSRVMTDLFIKPCIAYGSFELSIWQIFLLIWTIGIIIQACRLIHSYRSIRRKILVFGTNLSGTEPFCSLLHQICDEHGKKNLFQVYVFPAISTPMIYGLIKPYILLPENYLSDRKSLYYILCHEAAHFFHHDLWLKLFSQLLHTVFWWNPVAYLLKRQIATMLELRVDLQLTSFADPQRKGEYLDCLLNTSKLCVHQALEPTISFCSGKDSTLRQRFQMIINTSTQKKNRWLQCLFSTLFIGLCTFSFFFTFERSSVSPEVEENTIGVYEDNSYLIENPGGGYDLYIDDMFMETYPTLDKYLPKLKIYKTLEEVPNE